MSAPTELNIGPLSWVKDEINLALEKADQTLSDPSLIKQTLASLRQARGALTVVGLPGITEFAEALEQLVKAVEQGTVVRTTTLENAARNAIAALRLYLDTLVAGAPHQPLRLLAPYQGLFTAQGQTEPPASDLFFPDLNLRPPKRERPLIPRTTETQNARREAARYGFERGLERFLNGEPGGIRHLRNSIAIIELGIDDARARTFWWATLALMDAIAAGTIPNDETLHKLLGRITVQIRKLLAGSNLVAERLLRDVLYLVAVAKPTSDQMAQVHGLFRLDTLVPHERPDAEQEQRRQVKLHAILEEIPVTEDHWDRFCSGTAAALIPFHEKSTRISELAREAGQADLARLANMVALTANTFRKNPERYHDAYALEIATALLLMESGVSNSATDNFGGDFSHQADVLSRRLEALLSNKPIDGLETPHLDALTQSAREKRMFSQVSKEILSNMATVEGVLDAFFRNPENRAPLADLAAPLRQAYGALLMLGDTDAASLLQTCQAEVAELASGTGNADNDRFTALAHQLSALGMYLEQRRFGEAQLADFLAPSKPAVAEAEEATEDTPGRLEDHLASQAELARNAAEALQDAPLDESLRQELKDNLEALKEAAHLTDDQKIVEQASAALEAIDQAQPAAAVSEAVASLAHEPAEVIAVSAETAQLAAASDDSIDAEMLAIFIEEAQEVIQTLETELPRLKADPANTETLTTVRRAYHTLKGSSRMVGLNEFGEAAWGVEQVLNRVLKSDPPVAQNVLEMLDMAQGLFSPWVEQLANGGSTQRDAHTLAATCAALLGHEAPAAPVPPVLAEPPAAEPAPAPVADAVEPASATPPAAPLELAAEGALLPDLDFGFDDDLVPAPAGEATAAPSERADNQDIDPTVATEGALDLAMPDLEFPADPAPAIESLPTALDFAVADLEALDASTDVLPEAPETAAESTPAVEALDLGELADLTDLDFGLETPAEPENAAAEAAPALVESLNDLTAPAPADQEAVTETESPALTILPQANADAETESELDLAPADLTSPAEAIEIAPEAAPLVAATPIETPKPAAPDTVQIGNMTLSAILHGLYVEEARSHVQTLETSLFLTRLQPPPHEMIRAAHTLASASATTGFQGIFALAQALEKCMEHFAAANAAFDDTPAETAEAAVAALRAMIEAVAGQVMPELRPDLAAALAALEPPSAADEAPSAAPLAAAQPPVAPVPASKPAKAAKLRAPRIQDELDDQLLPLFLEESQDLMPALGEALRSWRDHPTEDTKNLQRILHTLKGSARMAGAMVVGELVHNFESRVIETASPVSPAQLDEFDGLYDHLNGLVERLRDPSLPPLPELADEADEEDDDDLESFIRDVPDSLPAPEPVDTPVPVSAPAPAPLAAAETAPVPAAPAAPATLNLTEAEAALKAQVRVRAELIDRLVNEAGEMAISRSRVEGEMRNLKSSLLELTENVMRLRNQVREIEIQAETQIDSRRAEAMAHNESFDPLEMDRFTRFQELTRMMAESVNDVATVQQNLLRNLDQAAGALNSQARINRDMSQELMGVRMMPFQSIVDRLHRVVRQSAKDLTKRANLDIRGGQIELDRSILEAMLAPMEHLLRNCVAHGLESRDGRVSAGKSEQGEIVLGVSQQGNEVMIEIADDGAGLNLAKIRSVAIQRGLIKPDQVIDERQLAQIIFQSGFSTASEVTAVAGRGVGLDVVRNEVTALGGRIDVDSRPGKGATFRIHLPVTLALTQAVLVKVGEKTYAIPSAMVEQANELKPAAIETLRQEGQGEWLGFSYPYFYLPHLLGMHQAQPLPQRRYWVLYIRTGSQRVAVEVDHLFGGQEVVVKNIGPQLARVAGISGATVLGDGEVVLIINPVALAERKNVVSVAVASDASLSAPIDSTPAVAVVPTVLVVDDSLTVRKITGRLLERAGYQVVTAKDGVDALEKLIDVVPDVVLSDIEMPRMDGFDFVRNMRNDPRLRDLPVIMITSRTAEKHRTYAKEIGVDHYLGKPYDEDELLSLIGGFVKR